MIRRKRSWLALALALPLLGLAMGWLSTHRMAQRGTDWQVEIAGYDPRDLLRGHYINYRYMWPSKTDLNGVDALCLKGAPPKIERAIAITGNEMIAGCQNIVRLAANRHESIYNLENGIYYVAQATAPTLEKKLADPALKAIMTIRVREDGYLHPTGITFQTRTANERAALEQAEAAINAPVR